MAAAVVPRLARAHAERERGAPDRYELGSIGARVMAHVFISHAPEDEVDVQNLAEAFRRKRWSVLTKRDLPGGELRAEAADRQLRTAGCVVVAWSRSSVNNVDVQHDASVARFRRVLVPALVDLALDANQVPSPFSDIQAPRIDLRSGTGDVQLLVASISRTLARPRARALRMAAAAFGLIFAILGVLSWGLRLRVFDVLSTASRAGLAHIEYRKFSTGENARLSKALRHARRIRLLLPNGNRFVKTFQADLAEFFRRPEVSMQVLLATPDSAFYEEETKMTLGADWTEERRKAAVEENRSRVGHAQALLVQLAAGRPQALEMRHFDTQFRLPIIVIDEQCFLTVRLSPDEGAQSLRLEFEGAEGYGRSCIAHFDRMWSLSAPTALALPH